MTHTYEVPEGGGLYLIWLSDTHYYGGRARSFKTRWGIHLRELKEQRHVNDRMQKVFNKHQRFEPVVLAFLQPEQQEQAEQVWLEGHLGRPGCVNISPASQGGGAPRSPETRRKISEGNKGKKLSEEHRQILLESTRNRVWTPEMRERLSQALTGHVRSEPSRAKQSATIRSRPDLLEKARASLAVNSCKDPEVLAANARKASESNRGRTQSPEHVEARASKHRGRKNSAETLARMSESGKRRAQEKPTAHGPETRSLISAQQAGRIWINDGKQNQRLPPEEAEPLLASGVWSRGRFSTAALKGLLWLHWPPTGELRRARAEQLPTLLAEGWERLIKTG